MDQQVLYARARTVMEGMMPTVDAEPEPKVTLVAQLMLLAKTLKRLQITDLETILGIVAGNVPGMIEMWDKAEDDTRNVIIFPGQEG